MTKPQSMEVVSLLFSQAGPPEKQSLPDQDPPYFEDLAIGRILDSVTKTYETYNLRPFFRFIPHQSSIIAYRNAILIDFDREGLEGPALAFRAKMTLVRNHLQFAEKSFNPYQAAFFLLRAINDYCSAVQELDAGLKNGHPQSDGLKNFIQALHDYVASADFQDLLHQVEHHHKALEAIRYTVLLNESTITVRGLSDEPDYNEIITNFFERFQAEPPLKSEKQANDSGVWIGNVQSRILDGVAQINLDVFSSLCSFTSRGSSFIDPALLQFERESQFYLSWIAFTRRISKKNLSFSIASLVTESHIRAHNAFDLALADKLDGSSQVIVTNDFYLRDRERIFVVTGPNQGGKTTFARTLGQMHYFANLGLSVPGESIRLKFFDRIFTHFEREEALTSLHGKLYDDLIRIHDILATATPDSLIILNEIFNSTSLRDAQFLACKVLCKIIEIGAIGVCVTFMDELARLGPETVSLTSMVEPENPAKRSFHVVRRQADGLAYALSIAKKYNVTYEQLKERLT